MASKGYIGGTQANQHREKNKLGTKEVRSLVGSVYDGETGNMLWQPTLSNNPSVLCQRLSRFASETRTTAESLIHHLLSTCSLPLCCSTWRIRWKAAMLPKCPCSIVLSNGGADVAGCEHKYKIKSQLEEHSRNWAVLHKCTKDDKGKNWPQEHNHNN